MQNDVTLFSNGIGHFRRYYEVNKNLNISIPFKKNHISDVASSLQVFGKVKLDTPPSFTPLNSGETTLAIDERDVMFSLLTSLSGAEVFVKTSTCEGSFTLLGVSRLTEKDNETLVVMDKGGCIFQFLRREVLSLEFLDKTVQAEIAKSLNKKYQRIKPDSSFLDLSLSSLESKTEAQVQYTVPVAAWKMRYSIRQKGNSFTLDGAAIIDNNTDEDWDNFKISVVTGNPISFATDIANVLVPYRSMVYLLDGESQGENHAETVVCAPKSIGRNMLRTANVSSKYANFGLEDCDGAYNQEAAVSPGVESKEVGDFCVFTAKEAISIAANRSAIVQMFSVNLPAAGLVLLYQTKKHESRMHRAIKFKNETEYSLGRGKTIVYDDGVFSGECILENTKPGENRILPHCLENGVKVNKKQHRTYTKMSSIRVSKGVAVTENLSSVKTSYIITNKKSESFKVILEYDNLFEDSNTKITLKAEAEEKIQNGTCYYFELKPKEILEFDIVESSLVSSKVELCINDSHNWFFTNLVNKGSFKDDPKVKLAIEKQLEIDSINESILEKEDDLENYSEQVSRVRENLKAIKENTSMVTAWTKDLDETEQSIRQITKVDLPKLNTESKKLREELTKILKDIVFEWHD